MNNITISFLSRILLAMTITGFSYGAEHRLEIETKEASDPDQEWLNVLEGYTFRYVSYPGEKPNIESYADHVDRSFGTTYYFKRPLREILDQVQAEFGKITMDCLLFTQIAYRLKHCPELAEYELNLGGLFDPVPGVQHRLTFNHLIFKKADHAMSKLRMINRGLWMLATSPGHHLALTNSGPVIMTKEQFVQDLVEGMAEEARVYQTLSTPELQTKGRNIQLFFSEYSQILSDPDNWEIISTGNELEVAAKARADAAEASAKSIEAARTRLAWKCVLIGTAAHLMYRLYPLFK